MRIIKQHLLSILSVLLLLFCVNFSALSQDRKEKFQPSYKSRIDLSVFAFPHKLGFYQNYQLYAQTHLKGRFGIGTSMQYLIFDPKFDLTSNIIDYRFSVGPSMDLLDLKWINVMTYTHLMYHNYVLPYWQTHYYGGGFMQGLRCDLKLSHFGVGVRAHTNISYGKASNAFYPKGDWLFDLRYGFALNLTYFITK